MLQIFRALHTSLPSLARGPGRRANRGVGLQLRTLESENEIQEDFGDLESDFMHVHRTHRQHERDLDKEREQVRHHMVRHKYFREDHLPNLLTYAEKEQIRLLHARDPEEWTAEKLAESFPATPHIVQKILQAKWRPSSEKRILTHDEGVMHNWEKLRNGDVESLPWELRHHLQRFATRKHTDLAQTQTSVEMWKARPQLPQPKQKEFLSIITSCKKYAHETSNEIAAPTTQEFKNPFEKQAPHADPDAETYLLSKVADKRKMRLQELKKYKLAVGADNSSDAPMSPNSTTSTLNEQAAVALRNPSGTGILQTYTQKFQSSEIVISPEDRKRYEMTSVKERIRIPRKVWRRGATYRVEDSYYDDDGEFLYRVPGMTGKESATQRDH